MRETLDDASSRFYFVESDIIWLKADVRIWMADYAVTTAEAVH